jgi:hypothetical protein
MMKMFNVCPSMGLTRLNAANVKRLALCYSNIPAFVSLRRLQSYPPTPSCSEHSRFINKLSVEYLHAGSNDIWRHINTIDNQDHSFKTHSGLRSATPG